MLHEDQAPEVFVPRHQQALFLPSAGEQLSISSTREPDFGSGNYVVAELAQQPRR